MTNTTIAKVVASLPRVRNMTSPNGNDVQNQFVITTDNAKVFQSYSSIIAIITGDKIYLDENRWNYSSTTSKYRNQFLGMDKAQTLQAIKSGEITLTNLN